MDLLTVLADLDENDELHMSRLLVLFRAFGGRDGLAEFKGLTKLAKLEFLLRYPRYLERALQARGADPSLAKVLDHERTSIESKMIRFHYGPWDSRYRRIVNLLVAKGLTEAVEGSPTVIRLTPRGAAIADWFVSLTAFRDLVERAQLLKAYFDMSGTALKQFVYSTFPEISSYRLGEPIVYEGKIQETDSYMQRVD